jgi:putative NADH-flavin reductase
VHEVVVGGVPDGRGGPGQQQRQAGDGKTLTVSVTGSYDTKFLSVVGIGSLSVTGQGKATLLHGVTAPEGN